MALWGRLRTFMKRGSAPAVMLQEANPSNVLVISDIHLGEDIVEGGPEHLAAYIRVLNRRLGEFIEYHAQHSIGGRPWHLVINGDMLDFVKIHVDLSGADAASPAIAPQASAGEWRNTAALTLAKLNHILEIHKPIFRQLADFIVRGNRVTILEGNHDAEFYFEHVKQRFKDFLYEQAKWVVRRSAAPGVALMAEERFAEAVSFGTWFLAETGRYHIEHGHQYDEFCSFEYNLAPLDTGDVRAVATPMSHRIMPYFVGLLGDFSSHGIEAWTFRDWLRYVWSFSPRKIGELIQTYVRMVYEQLRRSGQQRRALLEGSRTGHQEALRALSEEGVYGLGLLKRLERLTALPAEYSWFKMVQLFYVDRFVWLFCMALGLGFGAVAYAYLAWWYWLGFAALGALSWAGLVRLNRKDVVGALRLAAGRIAALTGARYVVFGHSHTAEVVNLRDTYGSSKFGEQAYYLNSGAWVTRELIDEESTAGMTYVEIGDQGAMLKRWCGVAAPPQVIMTTTPNT